MARRRSGELFPTDAPVAGADLIGRADSVTALTAQLEQHFHRIVTGPRRTGKTSVCQAAVDRLRRRGWYTVSLDMFALASLAEVAEALTLAVLSNRSTMKKVLTKARRTGRTIAAATATTVTTRMQGELGEVVEIAFRPGIADRDPHRYFLDALALCERVAERDDRQLVLFIDEFQEFGAERQPYGEVDRLTKQMRSVLQKSDRVTCLFAGSIEHLMAELFTPRRRAFYRFGGFFSLPPIDDPDWRTGLAKRFARDDCTIDGDALTLLVETGEGHPRATMLVAQQAHAASLAAETNRIDVNLVREGLALALAADAASLDSDVDRIRRLGRHTFLLARRVAHGDKPYVGSTPSSAARGLQALRDAGFVERAGRGAWRLSDPLLRRYLVDMPN
ncbi:MAG: ATPase [Actinomycetia bacterium]|nr:ATPase [Actinomycetes bacterium]